LGEYRIADEIAFTVSVYPLAGFVSCSSSSVPAVILPFNFAKYSEYELIVKG
jgi:hypothetical protein